MTETLEMTPPAAPSESHLEVHPPVLSEGWVRRVLRDSGYNLTAFPVALVAFVIAVTCVAVGAGTLVVAVGLVVLVIGVWAARGFADVERFRQRSLLGRPAVRPAYVQPRPDASAVRRFLTPLRDPQSWLDVLWSVLGFATGILAFSVTVSMYAGVLGGLTYGFWQQFIPMAPDDTLASKIGLGEGQTPEIWLNLFWALLGLLLLPLLIRAVTLLHAGLAQVLLCGRAELQADLARSEGGRDAARRAESTSLRRLERDIHDGPQQRLVRLQMDLGRAGKQVETDPVQARATIEAALAQARETVEELRSLSRGIAPPVLVDRGLEAALNEAFARSAVPVYADLRLDGELPAHVESTVYFVVAEALTNVAKHAGATSAEVSVVRTGDRLTITVTDDGVGGADAAKGSGLAGLAERVRGADGTLVVTSPAGGPTTLVAEVGCG
ncbi:MAG: histidine kinase [Nocardioidaceae bacterium]|nr:histidine kinase [Nocardioidaceae bacterium]